MLMAPMLPWRPRRIELGHYRRGHGPGDWQRGFWIECWCLYVRCSRLGNYSTGYYRVSLLILGKLLCSCLPARQEDEANDGQDERPDQS
jgi:hypothetical protein